MVLGEGWSLDEAGLGGEGLRGRGGLSFVFWGWTVLFVHVVDEEKGPEPGLGLEPGMRFRGRGWATRGPPTKGTTTCVRLQWDWRCT